MIAYFFLWNPKKDPDSFRNYERVRRNAEARHPYVTRWICPSKQPRPGDVAIVQRTGSKDNGVFAKGIVTSEPFEDDEGTRVVALKLDSFLPIGREIPREEIITAAQYPGTWSPMASGNVVPEPLYDAIQTIWSKRTSSNDAKAVEEMYPHRDALAEELVGLEGELLKRLVAHRRREIRLREQKIASVLQMSGSLTCEVPGCGFDFQRVYGPLGASYAHVHHLHPLSNYTRPGPTRLSDLAIVCANCHAMVHRGGECRELRVLIPKSKS